MPKNVGRKMKIIWIKNL